MSKKVGYLACNFKSQFVLLIISNSILVLEGKGIGEKKKEIGLKKTKKKEYKL